VLLDLHLKGEPGSQRPARTDTHNFESLVATSPAAKSLRQDLPSGGEGEAAAAARGLLTMCAEMGYEDDVLKACAAARTHVRDLGVFTGPLIVAALATVIAWVPVEKRRKVKRQTVVNADGTTVTSEEEEVEVKRVGGAALKALTGWWTAVLPGPY
jgi:hypothetical protein